MSARMSPLTPPFDPKVQILLDRLPPAWTPTFALFTVLARDPRLLKRALDGAPAYFPDNNLTVRQREILLLRVTARARCAYEWGMRVHFFANEAGLDDEQVEATVLGGANAACWSVPESLLVRLADSLHETSDIGEDLWAALSAAYSEAAILELLMLAGYYRTVAYLANGLRLPPEPKFGRPFPEAGSTALDGAALLRHVFGETAKGNGTPFVDALADDVRWIIPGTSSWSRTYQGKQVVLAELLAPLRRIFDGPNRVEALRIFGEGDQFVVEARGDTRTRGGVEYRNGYCWLCRVECGRITELVEYADTALMDSALGPPEWAQA